MFDKFRLKAVLVEYKKCFMQTQSTVYKGLHRVGI